ncbi:MAG: DUF1553 domain-containing protein [Verrucomicrobiae bacterium]|nr:DUF1553 domain-containing protein [Verrucomicrobiae bacterium]
MLNLPQFSIRFRSRFLPTVGSLLVAAFSGSLHAAGSETAKVNFNRDIRPILSDKCFFCHGPDKENQKADLRLDIRDSAIEAGAIVPSSVGDSTLLHRIAENDPDEVMPPPEAKLGSLTPTEQDLLKRWIAEGAEYQDHWSFVPVPEQVPVPDAGNGWARNEIDHFVAASLDERGLKPAPETERERWIRRVSFDLTGLPPMLEEIDAFLADQSNQAYEKVVDRLLDSSAYGERMAIDWLDQARYADTFGYQADRLMHVWPWRDWVIKAYNDNLPYNDFITWQIAGDLLPNATRDQQLATTFNRLHRQTNEGGSINEEFRVEYVNDRVTTVGTAFLGLTLECSRCHDHKYDPIKMRDFYSLTAFFNNIDESGLYSHFTETAPTPALPLFEGDQEKQLAEARKLVADRERAYAEELEQARKRFETASPVDPKKPEPVFSFNFDDGKASGANRSVDGKVGKAIEFTGDDPQALGDVKTADFSRTDPFSFSLWLKPAEHKSRMVVFHHSRAAEDSAFRGYELMLYEGKPTFSLIHFWPGDAIRVQSTEPLPLNEWTHLTITYDGSSRADGVTIYRNGKADGKLEIVRDKLTRDIKHRKEWGDSEAGKIKLELAGRFRDIGFGGGVIDEFAVFDRELSPVEAAAMAGAKGDFSQADRFRDFALNRDDSLREKRAAVLEARVAENTIAGDVRQIMTMRDMPGQRPAYVLFRGGYDQHREEVGPGVIPAILPFPNEAPRNRLGLAEWLTEEQNPLVPRVAANRLWMLTFSRGLVGTPEDFGSQGEPPSHPELLDWLARRFMDSGWNVKETLRTIVLSATYRQSSIPEDSKTWSEDPQNRWLARGPRHRLPAEQVRDNALAIGGLLVDKVGGQSVNPYELAVSFKPLPPDKGDGLYRRSLYTFWKRTAPPPVMVTFDATSREVCTPKRESTATPLQALVLMNGPQYVEAARALAERLWKEMPESATDDDRLVRAFRLCTSRHPDASELQVLKQLLSEQREHFTAQAGEAAKLLKVGNRAADPSIPSVELAAWCVASEALLNYDETYTKR